MLSRVKDKINFLLTDSKTVSGKVIDLILLAVNLTACALYVCRSYYQNAVPEWVILAEFVVFAIFLLEYIIRIWVAKHKRDYIFSIYGIIDLVSIIPFVVFFIKDLRALGALKILRILRFIRFLETETFFFGKISRFQLQVWRTIFTVFTILFVFSGLILSAESLAPKPEINTFGAAFYYCVITLSTVGYGDFTPVTGIGRSLTVLMIFVGAIMVPWQAGKLVQMLIRGEYGKNQVICPKCGLKGHDFDAVHCKACGTVIYQEYDGA